MHQTLQIPHHTPSERLWKDLFKVIAVSLFFAGMAILIQNEAVRVHIMNIPILWDSLPGMDLFRGAWSRAAFFVIASSLLIGVGLPRLWVSAIAGAVFGALVGTLLALAATIVGAVIVYWIGQTVLAGMIRRRIGPRLMLWQRRFETNAFWWVLYMRLFPLSNATLAALLCGACRIPVGPYLAGSLLGFIPLTLVLAIFGSGGTSGNFYQVALGALLLSAVVGGRKFMARFIPPLKPFIAKRQHKRLVSRLKFH